jgi:tRNA (mo5U34)-methyltransferase
MSAEFRATAATARLTPPVTREAGHLSDSVADWIQRQVETEPYWFQKVELGPGAFTPGRSDPIHEKLPNFGLPEDLTGLRVLDIGCAEGFFSFEAERRGGREVIGIDSSPECVRRFDIVKAARSSSATAFLLSVYDLDPERLGTFDLILFYGVFYHLKHPQLALERIRSVCTGKLLFQAHIHEEPGLEETPLARFYPHGMLTPAGYDPRIFWLFNSAGCAAILDHVGFVDLEILSTNPHPFVMSAKTPSPAPGIPPDQTQAPWC